MQSNTSDNDDNSNKPLSSDCDHDRDIEIETGNINELRVAMEEQLLKFPTIAARHRQSSDVDDMTPTIVLNDPESTLRSTVKAQARLGYTQTGAMLTWQNISCDNDNQIRLFPVCGYIKPKQMLCVLGGGDDSGVPELFQILRDPSSIYKSSDKGTFVAHGDVLLNGLPPGKFYKRTISYIPKTDNHLATLKVGETLLFSAKMRSPAHIQETHLQKSVDTVLSWLGLTEEHKNSFVGDANVKGISGGQKRRLSIGVEIVSGFSILIAELPTNGLDSKTAFEVVNSAKTVAKAGNKSMIMSLAQPSPELFMLFDLCCVLAMGECLFFGPQNIVQSYLKQHCKLVQPPNKSLPAWIEELTVKPSKFMSEALRKEILHHSQQQKSDGSAISDRQIIRFLAKKFRNSKFFTDLSKEVLWRHLDVIHHAADHNKRVKIAETVREDDQQPQQTQDEDDEKLETLPETKGNTPPVAAAAGDDAQFSSASGTDGGTGGFGALLMSLRRQSTDGYPSTIGGGYGGDTIVSGVELLPLPANAAAAAANTGDTASMLHASSTLSYEKTYDLRGLEHGFVWSLPRLPTPLFQIREIFKRQLLATSRNKALIFSRLFQAIIIALALGAVWFRLCDSDADDDEGQNMRSRVGGLFFIIGFMGFGAVPFIPSLSTQLPVFYYQKQNGYFQVYSFYLAQIVTEFWFSLCESAIFSLLAYFMVGFVPNVGNFLVFFVVTFLVRFTSWSFCMAVTGFVGNASVAQSISTVLLPVLYAFNGYLVPTLRRAGFVKFMAYCSFFTYPFQYLVRQELGGILHDANSQYSPMVRANAYKWLQNFGIDEQPVTAWDLTHVILVTIAWFVIYNIAAYLCLSRIDYSSSARKKSTEGANSSLDALIGVVADLCCCGLGRKQRQRRKDAYVARQIELYQKRAATEQQHTTITVAAAAAEREEVRDVSDDTADVNGGGVMEAPLVYLEFLNLSYTVPMRNPESGVTQPKPLLHNNWGYVKPGEVVALMGPSGAGKSTLLDVLAGKKNVGTIDGEVYINGQIPDRFYNRCFGYVEQFDSHMACLTVQEAIEFSANLRLSPAQWTEAQKDAMVHKVVSQLELTPLAQRRIGEAGDANGISQEAKKKVTIAVELVSNPGLLFLDEPTTGLDGGAAFSVMQTVRKLANEQQCAVICTIHQPSAEVFALFDKILLLQSGGKMVYFDAIDKLPAYYQRQGFGAMPASKNPADFAIEALEEAQQQETTPNALWTQSQECQALMHDLKQQNIRPTQLKPLQFSALFATSFATQMRFVLQRSWRLFTRDTVAVMVRVSTSLLMGAMLGVLYYAVNRADVEYGRVSIQHNMLASLLYVTVVYCSESAAQEIPLLVKQRAMFYRECDSKFYSIPAWYVARTLAQWPLIAAQALMFVGSIYALAYCEASPLSAAQQVSAMLAYFMGVLLMLMTATTFAQMLAICTPNEAVGNVMYTTLCTLCRMFGGFVIKVSAMAKWSRVLNAFNFFKYALFYLGGSQLMPAYEDVYRPFVAGQFWWPKATDNQGDFFPAEGSTDARTYYFGLVLFWVTFHAIALTTLLFKRWDKR